MIKHNGNHQGKIDCYGQSAQGRVRDVNSDQFLLGEIRPALLVSGKNDSSLVANTMLGDTSTQLMMVADGIGNGPAGQQAANLAVEEATRTLLTRLGVPGEDSTSQEERIKYVLRQAFHACQSRLVRETRENPEIRDLGTTLTIAYLNWPHLYLAHAGDSRCYLFHNLKLRQLTTDHTMAQRFIQEGLLDARSARNSRWNHVLWNAIGTATTELSPQIVTSELSIGDALLLCTDGLTRHMSDQKISQLLRHDLSAEESVNRLTQSALDDGGTDNVTIVIARFRSQEHSSGQKNRPAVQQSNEGDSVANSAFRDETISDCAARKIPTKPDIAPPGDRERKSPL